MNKHVKHNKENQQTQNNSEIVKLVEDNVWIGARAFVAPGLTIATGAIIGSGVYVIQNVERDSIVVGRPATKIKKRTYTNNNHRHESGYGLW